MASVPATPVASRFSGVAGVPGTLLTRPETLVDSAPALLTWARSLACDGSAMMTWLAAPGVFEALASWDAPRL